MIKFYIGSSRKNLELVKYYSKVLEQNGWQNMYSWANNLDSNETLEDLKEYSKAEMEAIIVSDCFILILSAGKSTHVELGIALALNKKVYVCSSNLEDFSLENTSIFYELPEVTKLVGTADENIKELIKYRK